MSWSTGSIGKPAPSCVMQTQPLSKRLSLLLPCADQRARQRRMGIVTKCLTKAFDNYLAKQLPFARPFLTNPLELSTLRIYICVKIYPTTLAEHPTNNNDPGRVLFWKSCKWKENASNFKQHLVRDDIQGHLLEQLVKSIPGIPANKWQACWRMQSCQSHLGEATSTSKLPHPNGCGLGFNTTLQGARLEKCMVLANNSEKQHQSTSVSAQAKRTSCIGIIRLNEHL